MLVLAACIAAGPVDVRAEQLSAEEARDFSDALKEVERGAKPRLDYYARKLHDPLARKIVSWYVLFQGGFGTDFKAIDAFIRQNPNWPRGIRLLARAEEALPADADPKFIVSWFGKRTPITVLGSEKLGTALIAVGRKDDGIAVIRKAWIEGDLTKDHENAFYRNYKSYLTIDDNRARADRLMWDGDYWAARRMMLRVDTGYRKLIDARTTLRRMHGNSDRVIADVPREYQDDPGLTYERVRWRRVKDLDSAYELLKTVPATAPRPDKWWDERSIQARKLLQKGFVSEAYRLAANHGLKPKDAAADHAEAEWLAGWIALRFLEDPKAAAGHFKKMYDAVSFPVSKSRGAYWLGRSAEAGGEGDKAKTWYKTASQHPTTYYGQLAAGKVAPKEGLKLPPDASVSEAVRKRFDENELVRAVRMLAQAGEQERLFSFTMQIASLDESSDWQVLTAQLARLSGRTDLAIRVAKNSLQDHGHYVAGGYPTIVPPPLPVKSDTAPEAPLVLAVVRQESEYDPAAVSHAGARGLMQLMPATAQQVAKQVGIQYSQHKLVLDPDYNVTLGQSYLASLLRDFNGYLPMAIAAYNAGPQRVRRWVKQFGDPRDKEVDAVDWIEMIPFSETRNYVQRVLENVQIYRLRLADTDVALRIAEDLKP